MSLAEQIQRVDGSQNDILKKVLGAFGVTVGENKIDQLAALAKVAPLLKENSLYSSATASLFGLGADSVPDDAFALLSKAALYKTITPTAQLGTLPEGSIIYLNENGSPVPFYVAKQGYEPSHNTNRVLVVRKDTAQKGSWGSIRGDMYDGSTIDKWMTDTYFKTLDSDVQSAIATTNIPYTPNPMSGDIPVKRISKSVFALSMTEFGMVAQSYVANVEGSALPIAPNLYTTPNIWTRTPRMDARNNAIKTDGTNSASSASMDSAGCYYLPTFTLPSTFSANTSAPISGLYDVSDNLLLKLPGVRIATGSYVGTGKYGVDNPNSLTFGFEPKFVLIFSGGNGNTVTCGIAFLTALAGYSYKPAGSNGQWFYTGKITPTFKTDGVTWTSREAEAQMNNKLSYYYVAIG